MKLKNKLVESVRIRTDRAELLKSAALEISLKTGIMVQESDLVNFLIDNGLKKIVVENDELKLK